MLSQSEILDSLKHSKITNYVIPGLESYIISNDKENGTMVRMFEMTREQSAMCVPHTHRYNFYCVVLEGRVYNTVWCDHDTEGDLFEIVKLRRGKAFGEYKIDDRPREGRFVPRECRYLKGESYSMDAHQVHSIRFDKGTKVLFMESKDVLDYSYALLPIVDGEVVDNLSTQPWMFRHAT